MKKINSLIKKCDSYTQLKIAYLPRIILVIEDAIKHNFNAYLMDMKSGFRDEINGYHLFTPCCHNPLSFRLTTLNKNCDWQTTYTV